MEKTLIKEHQIEWSDDQVSRLWDYYSKTPPYSDIYFSKRFGARILRESGVPMDEELNVLDFGCGPGFMWEHVIGTRAKWKYTGLDFSSESVDITLGKAGKHPQFVKAEHILGTPTPLSPLQFDVVFLIEVVEHLKDAHLEKTLAEAERLLKPGGVAVISTPNEEDLSEATRFCPECGSIYHQWQHVRSWSLDGLASRLQKHGLRLVHSKILDFRASGLLGRLAWILEGVYRRKLSRPHMIATFQKN